MKIKTINLSSTQTFKQIKFYLVFKMLISFLVLKQRQCRQHYILFSLFMLQFVLDVLWHYHEYFVSILSTPTWVAFSSQSFIPILKHLISAHRYNKTASFYAPPTIVEGHYVFWSVPPFVRSFVRPSVCLCVRSLQVKVFGQCSFWKD